MRTTKLRERLLPVATVAVLLVIWQVAVKLFGVPEYIMPTPTAVAAALAENIDVILSNSVTTLIEFWGGFALGTLVGLLLAIVMTLVPQIRTSVYPLVIASQTIPKIAIAPLVILWFGVGIMPKIAIVALLAFFPVLINTIAGFDNTSKGQLDLMRSVSATNLQVYRHIRVPAAVPYLFAGLKLGLTISVIGAIVAEWVGAQRGLGYLLILYNSSMRTPELFAVLVVIVLMAASAFLIVQAIEYRFSWASRISRASTRSSVRKAEPAAAGSRRSTAPAASVGR
jgi:NitT/TauT family transport system permease protein